MSYSIMAIEPFSNKSIGFITTHQVKVLEDRWCGIEVIIIHDGYR